MKRLGLVLAILLAVGCDSNVVKTSDRGKLNRIAAELKHGDPAIVASDLEKYVKDYPCCDDHNLSS